MPLNHAKNLLKFIENSPSSFFSTQNAEKLLIEGGFKHLSLSEPFNIKPSEKYYVKKNDSAIIAFTTSKNVTNGFNIVASHTDSPAVVIKPASEIVSENTYLKLNTEIYGGAILSSWIDRPLSLCGRVMLKSDTPLKPVSRLINIHKPLLIIPSLAIHLDREVNSGHKYSPQNDMLPVAALVDEIDKTVNESLGDNSALLRLIADELNVQKADILDFELSLYEYAKGEITGINNEFISASRLDDLLLVYNSLTAFISASSSESSKIRVLALVDNEEVGSQTSQGAKSLFLSSVLERICMGLSKNYTREAYFQALENSIIISADMAHALHPNFSSKSDLTNRPVLGRGVCLKYSAAQSYSTTAFCGGLFKELCDIADIKMQKFANNSDIKGGSTIGPMLAAAFSVPVIDMGCAILSMHSIRELASVADNYDCLKLFKAFYKL